VRAARELLALQSSDWAFLVTRDLAGDYPLRRVKAHLADHEAALGGKLSSSELRNLAPDLDLASLIAPWSCAERPGVAGMGVTVGRSTDEARVEKLYLAMLDSLLKRQRDVVEGNNNGHRPDV
jgi:hypothetical protein